MAFSPHRLVAISAIICIFLCGFLVSGIEDNLESECRPYVEKALKDQLGKGESLPNLSESVDSSETSPTEKDSDEDRSSETAQADASSEAGNEETQEILADESGEKGEEDDNKSEEEQTANEDDSAEKTSEDTASQPEDQSSESDEQVQDAQSTETNEQIDDGQADEDEQQQQSGEETTEQSQEQTDDKTDNSGEQGESEDGSVEEAVESLEQADAPAVDEDASKEQEAEDGESGEQKGEDESQEEAVDETQSVETESGEKGDDGEASKEEEEEPASGEDKDEDAETVTSGSDEQPDQEQSDEQPAEGDSKEDETEKSQEEGSEEEATNDSQKQAADEDSSEQVAQDADQEQAAEEESDEQATEEVGQEKTAEEESQEEQTTEDGTEGSQEQTAEVESQEEGSKEEAAEAEDTKEQSAEEGSEEQPSEEDSKEAETDEGAPEVKSEEEIEAAEAIEVANELAGDEELEGADEEPEETDQDELTKEFVIPEVLRPRDQLIELLHLDEESSEAELALAKAADSTLRELKRLYDSAIKPLEILYKYRDLSNRHFGDPEIFSKPLILFMGPWSGGKSSIINYLLDNEYNENSLRTGAEPSPAYFNIVTWGPEPEILDGTQLAADWTFSGLQKFGQGLEDRLRGLKLPNKLLEMVNIVEIPGILEVRKQVSRVFPFNDACQWFIDRADIIFLVYDPSKLDVGPETEAILDQLKGREYQTRVILNKADTVKPEELLRVQGALIWNISPLMSSPQPPIIYTTSLWSTPYNTGSPIKLLQSQERAFLRDIRQAIDKRVENKIASARRFAVRVRNHAKMVDCYLTTYFNHKTFFGNRKQVADDIIENPQQYHIYEGLSTLKNISRYDLPDPDTYRDFFRVNPLYDFQPLSSTCTYFKGCPINRLDVCIAYDLPELVGKHKKLVEQSLGKATLNS